MMRVLALVRKPHGLAPHQRFRLEQWAPYLQRDHGIALEFAPFESPQLSTLLYKPGHRAQKARLLLADARRRWRARHRVLDYDAVIVAREAMMVGAPWVERFIASRGVPFIYDFDDSIWKWIPGARNGAWSLLRSPWKVREICRLASAVTVGNDYLAKFARQYSDDVNIVRTSIDIERFPLAPEPPNGDSFTVVWTGSHSTLKHLHMIRPALEAVASRRRVRLRVVCDAPPRHFSNVETEFIPWRAETEATDLASGHVGVMPLPDDEITRGKCGCKALQYMAIGRPAVVTPVGINSEIVQNGVNGLWATDQGEWEAQLTRLADDARLRADLGRAGRDTVLNGYTAESSAMTMAGVIKKSIATLGKRAAQ